MSEKKLRNKKITDKIEPHKINQRKMWNVETSPRQHIKFHTHINDIDALYRCRCYAVVVHFFLFFPSNKYAFEHKQYTCIVCVCNMYM